MKNKNRKRWDIGDYIKADELRLLSPGVQKAEQRLKRLVHNQQKYKIEIAADKMVRMWIKPEEELCIVGDLDQWEKVAKNPKLQLYGL